MALLSEIDWVILVGAAAFLLLGPNNGQFVRQVGRWYGRAVRLKGELLNEVRRAADLPPVVPGQPSSLRATLLDWSPNLAVTYPAPSVGVAASAWSVARPTASEEAREHP
ncbi:MAG TPA: hypothetical protein VFF67_05245 [Thermoplasmata archaeon]|nr:hypothetical protein [Thermoplasmata archaeon]